MAVIGHQVASLETRIVIKDLPKTKRGHVIRLDSGTAAMLRFTFGGLIPACFGSFTDKLLTGDISRSFARIRVGTDFLRLVGEAIQKIPVLVHDASHPSATA